MIPSNRRNALLQLIFNDGYASTAFLANKLHVSQSTIRRDLEELQRGGQIIRTHGGSEPNNDMRLPIDARYVTHQSQKIAIARIAAKLLGNARLIFVDNSSTAAYLFGVLPKNDMTVWTNCADYTILSNSGIRIISTGGELLRRARGYIGGYAIDMLRRAHFDAAFISSSGISSESISDWSESETMLRREVIERSTNTYCLCDTSKLGVLSEYVVCGIDRVTAIVTEDGSFTPNELRSRYF